MPTALFSVYDKTDVVAFARELRDYGWDFLASGGTAHVLREGGLKVRDVADIVGGGAILGHRVVTLSRELHAGLLAREEDRPELDRLGIPWIDMVVVDMYPLTETIDMPGVSEEMVIEATDIGGPTLLRAAAKGGRIAVSSQEDWPLIAYWQSIGGVDYPGDNSIIRKLAAKAERVVAQYCLNSARYRSAGAIDGMIGTRWLQCSGENRWQSPAGAFRFDEDDVFGIDRFERIEGIEPSYTNIRDLDRLLQTMTHIAAAQKANLGYVANIAIGVKHGNPCGAAVANTSAQAIEDMIYGDTRAIFGGVVMTNFPIVEHIAEIMVGQDGTDRKRIFDGVAAPAFSPDAIALLRRKNGRCRLYKNEALYGVRDESIDTKHMAVPIRNGFLLQPNYAYVLYQEDLAFFHGSTEPPPTMDVLLAWAIGSTSNSNTVTLVRDGMLIGNGVGQQDRVGACQLAIQRANDAGHEILGAIAYSDSFFPFNDGPEALIDAGVRSIVCSSGSINDERLRQLCFREGICLMMVPDAQSRGFFGH